MRHLATTLYGDEGSLSWTITEAGDEVHLAGRCPSWRIAHAATRTLAPKLTERVDGRMRRVVLTWADGGVTVRSPDRVVEIAEDGLWDTDVLDIRLGYELAQGATKFAFRGVDPKTAQVFDFTGEVGDDDVVDGVPVRRVTLRVAGVVGWVAPVWNYWYDADGRMRRFVGPAGRFGPGR